MMSLEDSLSIFPTCPSMYKNGQNGQERLYICLCYLYNYMDVSFIFHQLVKALFYHSCYFYVPEFFFVFSLSHWKITEPWIWSLKGLKRWTVKSIRWLAVAIMPLCTKCPILRGEKKRKSILFIGEKECKHSRAQTCSRSCHFLVSHFVLQSLLAIKNSEKEEHEISWCFLQLDMNEDKYFSEIYCILPVSSSFLDPNLLPSGPLQ